MILLLHKIYQQWEIMYFLACLHFEMSSDLLLIDAGFLIMRSFSVVHKLQALDPGLYDWHFVRIFQCIVYLVPSLITNINNVYLHIAVKRLPAYYNNLYSNTLYMHRPGTGPIALHKAKNCTLEQIRSVSQRNPMPQCFTSLFNQAVSQGAPHFN